MALKSSNLSIGIVEDVAVTILVHQKLLIVLSRNSPCQLGHHPFGAAPEVDTVQDGVQPSCCDAVITAEVTRMVNAMVLRRENELVLHQETGERVHRALMSQLVQLVGERHSEGKGTQENSHVGIAEKRTRRVDGNEGKSR